LNRSSKPHLHLLFFAIAFALSSIRFAAIRHFGLFRRAEIRSREQDLRGSWLSVQLSEARMESLAIACLDDYLI